MRSLSRPLAILSLAGCATAAPAPPASAPEPAPDAAPLPRRAVSHADGPSCDEAMERHADDQAATPPSDEAVGGVKEVLNRGTYLNRCQIAASSAVEVCAAIANGEVLGVTVTIDPGTPAEADCVAGEVRQMSYPESPALIRAATTFDPSLGP